MRYLFSVIFFTSMIHTEMVHARLTAITKYPTNFLHRYYRMERNEDPPSESDLAAANASTRLRICQELSENIVFKRYGELPVNMEDIYEKLKLPIYSDIFQLIYRPVKSSDFLETDRYEYINPFTLRQLQHVDISIREYVFVCLMKRVDSNDIEPYYVSKVYNPLHNHRFIFPANEYQRPYTRIMLAENAAETYFRRNFNIELHYLELRKHHEPVLSNDLDPVCKLNIQGPEDDQSFRLCAIVLSSSHFKEEEVYPYLIHSNFCYNERISFRTAEAMEIAAKTSFYERMLLCFTNSEDGKMYYISRAYNPYEVFLYASDPITDNIYLEILSTDVNIVHERYEFGHVEI